MTKIGIDTNIFIYTLDKNSQFHDACLNILQNEEYELFTTSKNISEYISVCTKLGIEKEVMLGFYNEIKSNITVLFPSAESLSIFENLIDKYMPKGNRVYDVEIVSVFISNEIYKIATINIADFKNISEIELVEISGY